MPLEPCSSFLTFSELSHCADQFGVVVDEASGVPDFDVGGFATVEILKLVDELANLVALEGVDTVAVLLEASGFVTTVVEVAIAFLAAVHQFVVELALALHKSLTKLLKTNVRWV